MCWATRHAAESEHLCVLDGGQALLAANVGTIKQRLNSNLVFDLYFKSEWKQN